MRKLEKSWDNIKLQFCRFIKLPFEGGIREVLTSYQIGEINLSKSFRIRDFPKDFDF